MDMDSVKSLDNRILDLVYKEVTFPSEMERRICVPRTTIQYRLKKLEQSGFVKSRKNGRKTMWYPVFRGLHNKNHFKVYSGKDLTRAYGQFLNLPDKTVIFAVQGGGVADNVFSAFPELFIKEVHKTFKKREIVLKVISNSKILESFSGLDDSFIKSHMGRAIGVKFFFDDDFIYPGEVMSTKKILLLSNPKSKRAVVIKDRGITMTVYGILKLVFDNVLENKKTFDLNNYLKTKVTSK